jgi:hypothetical protein
MAANDPYMTLKCMLVTPPANRALRESCFPDPRSLSPAPPVAASTPTNPSPQTTGEDWYTVFPSIHLGRPDQTASSATPDTLGLKVKVKPNELVYITRGTAKNGKFAAFFGAFDNTYHDAWGEGYEPYIFNIPGLLDLGDGVRGDNWAVQLRRGLAITIDGRPLLDATLSKLLTYQPTSRATWDNASYTESFAMPDHGVEVHIFVMEKEAGGVDTGWE